MILLVLEINTFIYYQMDSIKHDDLEEKSIENEIENVFEAKLPRIHLIGAKYDDLKQKHHGFKNVKAKIQDKEGIHAQ